MKLETSLSFKLLSLAAALSLGACASSEKKHASENQEATVEHTTQSDQAGTASVRSHELEPEARAAVGPYGQRASTHEVGMGTSASSAKSSADAMRGDVLRPEPKQQISARLVNETENAKQHTAVVVVDPQGFRLTEASPQAQTSNREGHLHYRVDNGPSIATISTKLSFHDLEPGEHTIIVMPADHAHQPAGPAQRLTVTIPRGNEKYGEQ